MSGKRTKQLRKLFISLHEEKIVRYGDFRLFKKAYQLGMPLTLESINALRGEYQSIHTGIMDSKFFTKATTVYQALKSNLKFMKREKKRKMLPKAPGLFNGKFSLQKKV